MKKLILLSSMTTILLSTLFASKAIAQANTSLSNLTAPTAVNVDILPESSHSFVLGNGTHSWKSLYLSGGIYIEGNKFISAEGVNSAFLGAQAGHVNSGSFNLGAGFQALYYNTTGFYNAAEGYDALYHNTTGANNTANGVDALFYNTTGSGNTAMGVNSLYSNIDGTINTTFGYVSDVNAGGYSNSSSFGNYSIITASNQARIGDGAVTSIGGYSNWTNISDARVKKNVQQNVPGLAFINLLKPVTYNYDLDAADKIVWPNGRPALKDHPQPEELKQLDDQAKQEKEKITYTGFLAQDVEAAAKSLGYDFSGVDAPRNDRDLYGLRYAEFVVPLVKAVQELDASQKQEAKSQNDEMDSLKAEIEMLKNQISNIEPSINSNKELQTSNLTPETSQLYQNLPNPFNHSTIIPFHIPQNCSDASIMITNTSTGEVLSVIPVCCSQDHVQINADTFSSGNYSYSLYVNGKLVDTKQMMIAK